MPQSFFVMFSFSLGSRDLISFLTHSSFNNELFNHCQFVYLLEILFLWLILSLIALWLCRIQEIVLFFLDLQIFVLCSRMWVITIIFALASILVIENNFFTQHILVMVSPP